MPETANLEYKTEWKDDFLKVICAFANTSGGILYIGKDDNGNSVGVNNSKELLENLPNKINSRLGIVTSVNYHQKNGADIISIEVSKSTVPISFQGKYYKRSGSVVLELQGRQLSDFLLKQSGFTWDTLPLDDVTRQSLDKSTIDKFKSYALDRLPAIYKEKNTDVLLRKLNLFNNQALSRAAILLFGKQTQIHFPQAHVKIGRFISVSEMVSSDIVTGNLFEQVENVLEVLQKKYFINRIHFEGIHRREISPYPLEALREALINALIHRNYQSTAATQIRIYDHSLQIINDGRLPEEMSISDLTRPHLSYPRHVLLADIFYKAGFIESWGSGTLKISGVCKKDGLPEVLFEQTNSQFSVTFFTKVFKNEPKNEPENEHDEPVNEPGNGYNEPENEHDEPVNGYNKPENRIQRLLTILKNDRNISAEQLASLLSVSLSTIKRDLKTLKEQGKIKRIGSAKGGFWKVNHE